MSKLLEFFAQALDTFWNNRLRSLLTMLGLIIGIGAVIAILAVGDATNKSVKNVLSPLSQSAMFVFPKQQQPDPAVAAIRYDDAARISAMVKGVRIAPVLSEQLITRVNHKDEVVRIATNGAGTGLDQTPLAQGRRFTDDDLTAHRRVCILSDVAKQKFFPDVEHVVGQHVRIGGATYLVVGVVQPPISSGLLTVGGGRGAITVTIPYTLIPSLGFTYVFGLGVIADSVDGVTKARDDVIAALKQIHGERAQYDERDVKSLNDGIGKTFDVLTTVISIVGGISLLVGGVGIMNIMLVSVTERTREIGIRKAIGATRGDIALQFLTEAVLLCLIGGIIGLLGGVLLAEIVVHTAISQLTGSVVEFSWLPIVLIAVLFSVGVAVVFGTYPAMRAAALDPIDCLRYE